MTIAQFIKSMFNKRNCKHCKFCNVRVSSFSQSRFYQCSRLRKAMDPDTVRIECCRFYERKTRGAK